MAAEHRGEDAERAVSAADVADLYTEFAPGVRRLCLAFMGNASDADDVVQETFIVLSSRLRTVEGDPRGYALRVARNLCCSELLRRRRGDRVLTRWGGALPDEADHELSRIESRDLIQRVRKHLSGEDLLAFKRVADGLSLAEIGAELGVTESALGVRLCRARSRLRAMFGAAGAVGAILVGLRRPLSGAVQRVVRPSRAGGTAMGPAAVLSVAAIGVATLGMITVQPWGGGVAPGPHLTVGSAHHAAAALAPVSQAGVTGGVFPASTDRAPTPPSHTVTPGGVVGGLTDPGSNATVGNTEFTSITASPSYSQDHTIFASGSTTGGCGNPVLCDVLFRSSEGGRSWNRLGASRFAGGTILLPPSYPGDPTIFATGQLGLQRSDDGGATFVLVVPGVAPAAISPQSTPGDARILIGSAPLTIYDGATGAVSPGPVLPPGTAPPDSVAFAGNGSVILVTAEAVDPVGAATATSPAEVLRCDPATGCALVATRSGASGLQLAVSSTFDQDGSAFAFEGSSLLVSRDGGRTFRDVPSSAGSAWQGLGLSSHLAVDGLVIAAERPNVSGRAATLSLSRDAGSTFVPLSSLGLAPDLGVNDLVVLPDGHVLAGVTDAGATDLFGLRCSTDLGTTWAATC